MPRQAIFDTSDKFPVVFPGTISQALTFLPIHFILQPVYTHKERQKVTKEGYTPNPQEWLIDPEGKLIP